MDQIKIGKYIAEKRKSMGLTQMQLADKLGMSNKSVSKWERGVCLPDVSLYEPLCEALGISINEFIAGEDIVPEDAAIQADRNIISITTDSTVKRNRLRKTIALLIAVILILLSAFIWFLRSQDYFLSNYIKPYHEDSAEYRAATTLLAPYEVNMFQYKVDPDFTRMILTVYGYESGKLITDPQERIDSDFLYFENSEKRSGTIAALYKNAGSNFTLLSTDTYGSQGVEIEVGNVIEGLKPSSVVFSPEEDLIENVASGDEYPLCGYYFDGDEVTGVSPSEYFYNHEDNPSNSEYAIIVTVKFVKEDVTDVSVPDLAGLSLDNAISCIEESRLHLGNVEYIDISDKEEYFVKSQDPAAGSLVPEGSSVDVSVIKK